MHGQKTVTAPNNESSLSQIGKETKTSKSVKITNDNYWVINHQMVIVWNGFNYDWCI